MFTKALSLLPFAAFALIAAKPAPQPAAAPQPSIIAPAVIVAYPSNHLFLELSTGG
jgi:hypothetical protein